MNFHIEKKTDQREGAWWEVSLEVDNEKFQRSFTDLQSIANFILRILYEYILKNA